ncbi:hypothetical protein [Oceaniglobus roseus]|uniref:hypothetical protein n=1 Tax=Oceaniglobus roseus TaxID=1737570 RepID=UPI0012FFD830|nr:hypothetical protein [Kandeliimicrobium roseum]
MATFIYCPVMTGEMAFLARKWNEGRAAIGKPPHLVIGAADSGRTKALRRAFVGGDLGAVAADDKLYLLAHGYWNAGEGAVVVGARRGDFQTGGSLQGYTLTGGADKIYTPDQLARHLDKEGLRKDFVDLRLFCCGTGLDAVSQVHGPLAPYAQRLRLAMAARGHDRVAVTGYLGSVSASHDDRPEAGVISLYGAAFLGRHKGVVLPGDRYATRASDHRVRLPPED